eukprot:Nk52_evm10s148 gene=Nk52_evmTU10s148
MLPSIVSRRLAGESLSMLTRVISTPSHSLSVSLSTACCPSEKGASGNSRGGVGRSGASGLAGNYSGKQTGGGLAGGDAEFDLVEQLAKRKNKASGNGNEKEKMGASEATQQHGKEEGLSQDKSTKTMGDSQPQSPPPSRATSSSDPFGFGHCLDVVSRSDHESYLASLFLPTRVRESVLAVRAFNVELALVREVASNPTIARMRFQWWRQAVNDIYSRHRRGEGKAEMGQVQEGIPSAGENAAPIARALSEAVRRYNLNKLWLLRLIEHRESDAQLGDHPFRDVEEMEKYCEGTVGSLLYLTLQSMRIDSIHADHAASHVAKAIGIVQMLRAVPFHAQRRRCLLPVDAMAQNGASQEDVFSQVRLLMKQQTGKDGKEKGREAPKQASGTLPEGVEWRDQAHMDNLAREGGKRLQEVVYELASVANTHLVKARSFQDQKQMPPHASKALLPCVVTGRYLEDLRKVDFDVFHPYVNGKYLTLPYSLFRHAWRGTF